jgi:hypothetical protein
VLKGFRAGTTAHKDESFRVHAHIGEGTKAIGQGTCDCLEGRPGKMAPAKSSSGSFRAGTCGVRQVGRPAPPRSRGPAPTRLHRPVLRAPDGTTRGRSTERIRAAASRVLDALRVHTSGRKFPVASANPAPVRTDPPLAHPTRQTPYPEVPTDTTTSPTPALTPRAAPALSPAPAPIRAPHGVFGPTGSGPVRAAARAGGRVCPQDLRQVPA